MKKKYPYRRNRFKYYYNNYNDKVMVGYAIFRYTVDGLYALAETSFSMFYSKKECAVFSGIPDRYFYPQDGDFLIKTTRQYCDLEILGKSGHKSNYLFRRK